MTETQEWVEAPDELRSLAKSPYHRWAPLLEKLREGKTAFVKDPEADRAASSIRVTLKGEQSDKMLRVRTMMYENARGQVMWLVDRPQK